MIVRTVFLCYVAIRCNLKLQNVDKGDVLHYASYGTVFCENSAAEEMGP